MLAFDRGRRWGRGGAAAKKRLGPDGRGARCRVRRGLAAVVR